MSVGSVAFGPATVPEPTRFIIMLTPDLPKSALVLMAFCEPGLEADELELDGGETLMVHRLRVNKAVAGEKARTSWKPVRL